MRQTYDVTGLDDITGPAIKVWFHLVCVNCMTSLGLHQTISMLYEMRICIQTKLIVYMQAWQTASYIERLANCLNISWALFVCKTRRLFIFKLLGLFLCKLWILFIFKKEHRRDCGEEGSRHQKGSGVPPPENVEKVYAIWCTMLHPLHKNH